MRARATILTIGAAAAAFATVPVSAETLRGALLEAYMTNPTLNAARAGQRANDENVPITLAGGRPSVSVSGFYNENVRTSPNSFTAPSRITGGQADATLPIYQGGTVRNQIRAARAMRYLNTPKTPKNS